MRANLDELYDETVTVLNRIDAREAGLKQDAYHATVLHGCMWDAKATRAVQSDGTVLIGTVHRLQIPESDAYVPYREFSKLGDREGRFTLRHGDYVVRGEVEEEVDASNVKRIVDAREPDAFQVQHFRNLTRPKGLNASKRGVLRFSECYYVEG
jgi:hypothetical protein